MLEKIEALVLRVPAIVFFFLAPFASLLAWLFFFFFFNTCQRFTPLFCNFQILGYLKVFFGGLLLAVVAFLWLYMRGRFLSRALKLLTGFILLLDAVFMSASLKMMLDVLEEHRQTILRLPDWIITAEFLKIYAVMGLDMVVFGIAAVAAGVVVQAFFEPKTPKANLAKSVVFEGEMMWVQLNDSRCLGVPLAYFPRLLYASAEARAEVVISGGGQGLHWDALDEDISVMGLLQGFGDQMREHQTAVIVRRAA